MPAFDHTHVPTNAPKPLPPPEKAPPAPQTPEPNAPPAPKSAVPVQHPAIWYGKGKATR